MKGNIAVVQHMPLRTIAAAVLLSLSGTVPAQTQSTTTSYQYDAMGNRISDQVKDLSGISANQTTKAYDALGRLQ